MWSEWKGSGCTINSVCEVSGRVWLDASVCGVSGKGLVGR